MATRPRDREGLASRLYRYAPRTLRGRLIGTTLVVALVVVASTFTIASALSARMLRVRAESEVEQSLTGLSDYLKSQADQAGFVVESLAARSDIRSALATGDAVRLGREIDEALPSGREGYEVLVVDASGKTLYWRGPKGCIECMRALVSGTATQTAGVLRMPDGPYLVTSRPIASPTGAARPATIVVSRRAGAGASGVFPSVTGVSLRLKDPGTTTSTSTPGWQSLAVGGYENARFVTSGAELRTAATLVGMDGRPVVDVLMSQTDDAMAKTSAIAWISILASSIFAGIIGLSVGVIIADLVREPVDSMVSRVKKEGYRAIEGMPYSGVSLDNPRLPREFRELGAVIDGLLYGLSARQAELKRVTTATQEAEEALAVTVNESADAMILVQDGLIRIANPATVSHFGVAPRNLLGRTPSEVFDGVELAREDGTPLRWDDLSQAAGSEPQLARVSIAGRGERWLEVRVVHPPAEIKDRLLLTARDISDSRRLEQLRAELISMISHDLRSPLTVIVGYLDLLSTELPDAARDKAISSARASAVRMESMLEDLLSATRAEELFSPKVLLPVSLCDMAADVANSMRATAPNHTVTVACEGDKVALGEEKRLRQALVNLVGNAIKYSPKGTEITISVAGADDGRARLIVEDRGPGVTEDAKFKVFDRFTRIESSAAGKPGLGLGLYIVKVIAEGHGGRVCVEDRRGGGARFIMELPATDRPSAPSADPRLSERAARERSQRSV